MRTPTCASGATVERLRREVGNTLQVVIYNLKEIRPGHVKARWVVQGLIRNWEEEDIPATVPERQPQPEVPEPSHNAESRFQQRETALLPPPDSIWGGASHGQATTVPPAAHLDELQDAMVSLSLWDEMMLSRRGEAHCHLHEERPAEPAKAEDATQPPASTSSGSSGNALEPDARCR
jgi:hypothetical protein